MYVADLGLGMMEAYSLMGYAVHFSSSKCCNVCALKLHLSKDVICRSGPEVVALHSVVKIHTDMQLINFVVSLVNE